MKKREKILNDFTKSKNLKCDQNVIPTGFFQMIAITKFKAIPICLLTSFFCHVLKKVDTITITFFLFFVTFFSFLVSTLKM